ncbi:hypothetical protein MMC25_007122 [Agyrium rufum]|nr:hypothetical protein [Agyrium rufum]
MSRPEYQRTSSTNLGTNYARPLDGRVAIVTGGSRGIGAAIVEHLAAKGAHVVINYTSDSSTQKTKDLAESLQNKHGITAIVVQANMGDPNGPKHIVETAKNHFSHPKTGKFQIDIIVNNAGVAENFPLTEVTPERFYAQYNVNVLGPALLVSAAAPYLPNDRSGRIVNVSSVSAVLGFPGQTIYGGTKAALEHMTRTWARELAEKATVNAVNPGPVETDMWNAASSPEFLDAVRPIMMLTPLAPTREGVDRPEIMELGKKLAGRPAYPSEIAGVVGMLCSQDSGWCTGSTICANGGMYMSR